METEIYQTCPDSDVNNILLRFYECGLENTNDGVKRKISHERSLSKPTKNGNNVKSNGIIFNRLGG